MEADAAGVARYQLHFQGDGVATQLLSLQLECGVEAAVADQPDCARSLYTHVTDLAAKRACSAHSAPEAVEFRHMMLQHAQAAAGCPDGWRPPDQAPTVLQALTSGPAGAQWSSLLDQASQARQLSRQLAEGLRSRLPHPQQQPGGRADSGTSASAPQVGAPPAGPPRQQAAAVNLTAAAAAGPSGGGAAAWPRQPAAPPASMRMPGQQVPSKRDAAGAAKHAGSAWGQPAADLTSAKRQAAAAAGGTQAGGMEGDPIEVSDEKDGGGWAGRGNARQAGWQQQQHQQQQGDEAAGGGSSGTGQPAGQAAGVPAGFQTARTQLASDMRRRGQHQQAAKLQNAAPRTGLARPGNAGRGGSGAGGRGGSFVPPFMAKAIEAQTGQAPAGGGADGAPEGPLSARTLEMLGAVDDELPAELQKHDPRLIEQVCSEVIDSSGGVAWDDIAGLQAAKDLVKEIVVWPMLNPTIFTGPRAPPKGILLFGPPGTGKTLVGKAIASNISASFFSISASSLTSKWIGESEKMVRTLFAVAGHLHPSVIFIDEIDSILSARKAEGEHEASRRLKTEMLVQMEGCDPASAARRILLVGATNRPEELDEAARRRMPKQLYIPLPCSEARRAMVLRQLGPGGAVRASLTDADLDKLVAHTAGYSGSDMRNLIQEACQGPVRDAVAEHGERVSELSDGDLRAVRLRDFQHAAKVQRASVTPEEIVRYQQYNDRHGAKHVAGSAPGAGGGDASDDESDAW